MAEIIYTRALTTLTRVKNRLGITTNSHDTELNRLINAATDWIETYCNRKFVTQTYTQQVYKVDQSGEKYLFLKNYPVTALSTLEYSAGTPSNKNWTEFLDDDWELEGGGESGIVRIYGGIPRGPASVRATYTAGYTIDWSNAGNSTHTLPADLTDLCERMVTRLFKKRELEGRSQEAFEGATITWESVLNEIDRTTLDRYKRLTLFV